MTSIDKKDLQIRLLSAIEVEINHLEMSSDTDMPIAKAVQPLTFLFEQYKASLGD